MNIRRSIKAQIKLIRQLDNAGMHELAREQRTLLKNMLSVRHY